MENPLISGIRTAILPKIGNDLAPAAARTCSPDRAPAQHTRPATRRSTPICAVAGLPEPDTAAAPNGGSPRRSWAGLRSLSV